MSAMVFGQYESVSDIWCYRVHGGTWYMVVHGSRLVDCISFASARWQYHASVATQGEDKTANLLQAMSLDLIRRQMKNFSHRMY